MNNHNQTWLITITVDSDYSGSTALVCILLEVQYFWSTYCSLSETINYLWDASSLLLVWRSLPNKRSLWTRVTSGLTRVLCLWAVTLLDFKGLKGQRKLPSVNYWRDTGWDGEYEWVAFRVQEWEKAAGSRLWFCVHDYDGKSIRPNLSLSVVLLKLTGGRDAISAGWFEVNPLPPESRLHPLLNLQTGLVLYGNDEI